MFVEKKWFVAAVVVGVFSFGNAAWGYEQQVKALATELAKSLKASSKGSTAVVDLVDLQGNITELGRFLAEELSVSLSQPEFALEVADRNHLAAILRENKLSIDGLADPANTKEVGKLARVTTLVTGSLTAFGDSVRISVKVIDTTTAKMIGSDSQNIPKTQRIEDLLANGMGTGAGPVATSAGKKAAPKPQPQQVTEQGFVVQLDGCELAGSNVHCRMTIANTSKPRDLYLYARTELYDNQGNLYNASKASIANSSQAFSSGWGGSGFVRMPLQPHVPVRAAITFSDFAPQATEVAVLKVIAGTKGEEHFVATFRNLALAQQNVTPILESAGGSIAQGLSLTNGTPLNVAEEETAGPIKAKEQLKKKGIKILTGMAETWLKKKGLIEEEKPATGQPPQQVP